MDTPTNEDVSKSFPEAWNRSVIKSIYKSSGGTVVSVAEMMRQSDLKFLVFPNTYYHFRSLGNDVIP